MDSSRLDRLEETLAQLQRNLTQTVASAVQAALASHKPPVGTADLTAIPATQVLSPARASKPAKAPQAKPAAEMTDVDMGSPSHPPWEFKSGSPVMEVLGSVYSHLIATGAEGLAADLFSVRAEIDYAFMLPAEASSEEPEANVYTSKYSKKRWKRDHPAPGLCFECHGPLWRENCPVAAKKTENSASRTLQRGAPPPGRYYISKGGQVFDTTRRPLQECKRCSGKYHWFWNCSRGPEVLHIPRGASFTNTVDVRPVNASGARFSKPRFDTTSDGEAYTDSSATAAENLPAKRSRKVSQRARTEAPQGPPPAMPDPAYQPTYQPAWGWYPPAMWNPPPWASQMPGFSPAANPHPTDPQRMGPRAPVSFPEQQPQQQLGSPPAYSQWTSQMPPPPPPAPMVPTHTPYAPPTESGAAHGAAY